MATRVEVEHVVLLGGAVEAVDLVVEHRRGQVVVDGALPRRAPPGRAPPVGDDDGEALVGEPLRGQVGVVRLHDARAVRTAVRVEQHRAAASRRGRGGAARRWPGARSPPNDSRTSARSDGVAACRAQLDAVERLPLRARLGQRRRAHDDRAAAGGDRVHARLVGQRLAACRPASRRQTWIDVASSSWLAVNTIPGAVDGRHGAHLQVGRRDRLAVDEQAAGAVAVGARDERAVGQRAGARRATSSTQMSSWSSASSVGRAGGRVDPAAPPPRAGRGDCTVIDQAGVGPVHVGEVGERRRGPTRRRRSSRRGR